MRQPLDAVGRDRWLGRLFLSPLSWLLWAVVVQGCSGLMTRSAVDTMSSVIAKGLPAYEREADVELAAQALAANLKFIEVLLETDPDNHTLLLHVAQGFSTYAYAVVEGQMVMASTPSEQARHTQRALRFYQRGLAYSLRLLSHEHEDWEDARFLARPDFSTRLQQLSRESAPALFWAAFSWGGQLKLTRNALETITALPRFNAMVSRLIELDEQYYYGMPHVLRAVHYAGRAPTLGGNPKLARQAFARAKELSADRLLIVPLLEAEYYAVQIQDRELFVTLLQRILQASDTLFPEQAWLNGVAKQRAALLLQRLDDLFL